MQRGFARATTREIAATAGSRRGHDLPALRRQARPVPRGVLLRHQRHGGGAAAASRNAPAAARCAATWSTCSGCSKPCRSARRRCWRRWRPTRSWPSSFAAHVADNALEGFELSAPAAPVSAYIRAEQRLGRIRADVDAGEAAAVVVALPFARGTERALGARLPARGSSPEPQGFPAPAAAALDILAQGLAPSANGIPGGSL